ncbi:MAG TPA: Crp/Fnr family transcriptional regulator [Bacilli bacterium]|nr:Crp/Fnr family transcriptional regulator [Bacilli bacterium]
MNDKQIQSCIEHVPIFTALNQAEKDQLILVAKHEAYAKSDFIYMAGDELEALYVVHKGNVKIIKYTSDGKEQVLRILKHGDFFGETALFGNKLVDSFAEITSDAVICKIEQSSFTEIINRSPQIATKMLSELSKRLQKLEETITFNNLKSADAKIAKYLIDAAVDHIVTLTTTKKNISALLGITPETFSRRLKSFAENGHLKLITNKKILITNPQYLEALIY